jgi:hypothetical protein
MTWRLDLDLTGRILLDTFFPRLPDAQGNAYICSIDLKKFGVVRFFIFKEAGPCFTLKLGMPSHLFPSGSLGGVTLFSARTLLAGESHDTVIHKTG